MRTASGIAVVAVMAKPHRCPHIAVTGNICVYCPGVNTNMIIIRAQIVILNIPPKVTLAMNPPA